MSARFILASCLLVAVGCTGPAGQDGTNGTDGTNGQNGSDGQQGPPGSTPSIEGTIGGTVVDGTGSPLADVAVATNPGSFTATSAADGTFTIDNVPSGDYAVTGTLTGYGPYTLTGVGVAAGLTTNVDLALSPLAATTGSITGKVTDSQATPVAIAGSVVTIEGTTLTATTAADGTFSIDGIAPGPVFLSASAPDATHLGTETREASFVAAGGTIANVTLVLSARPDDSAHYVGAQPPTGIGCAACHSDRMAELSTSAHNRSLTRVARTPAYTGPADNLAFARMLNPTLTASRIVMAPLAGTITLAAGSTAVTGTSTTFTSDIANGDVLGYTPAGLAWQPIGTVASVTDDTHLTLAAAPTFAPTVTSLSASKYSTVAKSRTITSPKMLPIDSGDIVAPAWPGVKATNPNYDPNDPCIYGNPTTGTCAAGGTTKYADGQVNVYWCNLKGATLQGVTYANDEYVQKFGGSPYSCADGTFYDGTTTPAVPMVHVDVIYGGQGDKDGTMAPHPNMGVFKQRFQGRLADVKSADSWTYTTGKQLDSLTLPIQVMESGDKLNGGFKMNGYHPTEQKFPGESWTQQTRTFSHACAGCHNTGMQISYASKTVTLPFRRDDKTDNSFTFSAITSYSFIEENLTCEHCHGPGSEHIAMGGGRGHKIINPKYLTAEDERQTCGKCHAYDDATNASPVQDYGFEFPYNDVNANKVGNGQFIAGVYQLGDFFDNWDERAVDDEAGWDPNAEGGTYYGQAHRQQYTMLDESKHANNPYTKLACSDCHNPHTEYRTVRNVTDSVAGSVTLADADYKDNVLCLSCHAGFGPYASLTPDDVAALHIGDGGTATDALGNPVTKTSDEIYQARLAVNDAVSKHMFDKVNMVAVYDPTNDALPVGRCTSCHMPKLAKSGGYITGLDAEGNKTVIEGDQASHVFDVVWPWQGAALSRGGPTFQSGYYGQWVSGSGTKYDLFGYMPNSCSSCHANARWAAKVCPDTSTVYPSFWPFSEHQSDPYWASCFTSKTAP